MQWQQVRAIFTTCVKETDAIARTARLDSECGDDEELRLQVLELLAAHDASEGFLERPLMIDLADPLFDPADFLSPDKTKLGADETGGGDLPPGTRIGPYCITELIGRGGMGLVYVAQQQSPIQRYVALKLIKPGMDSVEVVARFRAEQQTLALMQHPNIASVFDVGTTESGRPWFVMEFVDGLRVTEFCDLHRLSLDHRLKLFIDICRAVQHAHQRGIIHRDLKPSNILVTQHDQRAVVKVIDFGVAKALTQSLAEKTLQTRFGELIGTPMYMSPEQADLGGMHVDTRSDIYSLGVLLYTLLSGATPFDPDILRTASFDELRRILRSEEPRRPSVRIAAAPPEVRHEVAAQRRLEGPRLVLRLKHELDWIVMKAMDKDRSRRYPTVEAFAADIERYFRNEPVIARPPSRWYLAKKFSRRYRVALSTASIVVVALAAGLAMAMVQTVRAVRAERGAVMERNRALRSERDMQELLYAADMQLAADSFLDDDTIRAHEALARHVPRPGAVDLRGFEWHLLYNRANTPSEVLFQADDPHYFCCAVHSTDTILSCGADGVIRAFAPSTGKLLHSVRADQGELNGLAVSPDETMLASTGDDGTVALWDLPQLSLRWRVRPHGKPAWQAAFSPDGRMLVTCGDEPDAAVLAVSDGSRMATLGSGGIELEAVTVTPAGRLVLAGDTGTLFCFQFPELSPLEEISGADYDGRSNTVACVAASPDGNWIAEGHEIGFLNLRSTANPGEIRVQQVLNHSVQSLAISPDQQWLAAGDRAGAITLFSLPQYLNDGLAANQDSSRWRRTSWNAHDGRVYGLTFSADGRHLVSAGEDGRLIRWNPEPRSSFERTCTWTARCVLFDPQNRLIAAENSIQRRSRPDMAGRDAEELESRFDFGAFYPPVAVAIQSGDIAWVNEGGSVLKRLGDGTAALKPVWQLPTETVPGLVALSPDGRRLAVEVVRFDQTTLDTPHPVADRHVQLIECITAAEIAAVPCNMLSDLTFSADGNLVAFGVSSAVHIVDVHSGTLRHRLPGHRSTARGQAFSPDDRLLATVGDRTLKLWNIVTGDEIWSVTAHAIAARDVAFTPDGLTVLTVGDDNTLRCWRWRVRQRVLEVELPPGAVRKVEISPDGQTVALSYLDTRVVLIDVSPRSAERSTSTGL